MRGVKTVKDFTQSVNMGLHFVFSGFWLTQNADETVGYCIDAIKDYACSGTGCRGGCHLASFWDEEAYAIKKVMTYLAKAFKATLQEIGAWLVWAANRIYKFNALELRRADSEVKDIADGRYDWRIDRLDRGQGGGLSR